MTKALALAAMFVSATFLAGCDGGDPNATAESTPATTEQTDTTTTGTATTGTETEAKEEDAEKPAATE